MNIDLDVENADWLRTEYPWKSLDEIDAAYQLDLFDRWMRLAVYEAQLENPNVPPELRRELEIEVSRLKAS